MSTTLIDLSYQNILDSLNDGVYVVDIDRHIIYWGKSAERITGWSSEQVLGKSCADNVLCHVDKDGRQLCGEETCPLHRAMVTGQSSVTPIVVFAQGRNNERIPMRVSVAPIYNDAGDVVGGVETFRDLSEEIGNFHRARKIQNLSHESDLPDDARIGFNTHYAPHDIVGGDFYAIRQLDDSRYGFLLADVSGHGMSAALYTMYLSSLWQNHGHQIDNPSEFLQTMNGGFATLLQEYGPFATAIAIMIDLENNQLTLASAGNPPALLVKNGSVFERLDYPGLPLGCMADAEYEQTGLSIESGDRLLLYTDGAIEIIGADDKELGVDGLIAVLKNLDYPNSSAGFKELEMQLLQYSDRIRFDDDLTFVEVQIKQ